MQESGPEQCERCGGELRRVFFPAGIIFKGSGFYKTDSRSAGSSTSTTSSKSGTASSSGDTKASSTDSGGDGSSGSGKPAKDAGKKESA